MTHSVTSKKRTNEIKDWFNGYNCNKDYTSRMKEELDKNEKGRKTRQDKNN